MSYVVLYFIYVVNLRYFKYHAVGANKLPVDNYVTDGFCSVFAHL